ncbi:stage 0 sporulation family protein [Chloroflexota bacterium]
MAEIVGVRFKRAGRVYYFDPAGIELDVEDCVIVNTSRGIELGRVVIAPRQLADSEIKEPLKPVERKAEEEDIERIGELEAKAAEVMAECGGFITELELPMKLISAEYNIDGSRLTFLFSADDRVDFRELVRRLTKRFKARVELRQVGSRDEAKLVGGFGRCGRPLCCMSFLDEFSPVSIKMAKEQDLSLNPMKISGVCGRLMCCLGYESEQYRQVKLMMPRVGQRVSTKKGEEVTVIGTNMLKETVTVASEGGAAMELPLDEIKVTRGKK